MNLTAGRTGCGPWRSRAPGLQFKAQQWWVVPPSNLEGIEKYLGSGMVKGIGPHFARKLARAFGKRMLPVVITMILP